MAPPPLASPSASDASPGAGDGERKPPAVPAPDDLHPSDPISLEDFWEQHLIMWRGSGTPEDEVEVMFDQAVRCQVPGFYSDLEEPGSWKW